MRLLSPRLLIPLVLVVVVWGGAHLLTSHDAAVTPAVWPIPDPTPSPTSALGAVPAVPTTTPAPPATAAIPVLPGVLRQLNGSTRDTAVGLYAVLRQLEEALRRQLEQLAGQLEPGGR